MNLSHVFPKHFLGAHHGTDILLVTKDLKRWEESGPCLCVSDYPMGELGLPMHSMLEQKYA